MKKSSVLFVLMAASGICFSSVYAQKRLVLDLNQTIALANDSSLESFRTQNMYLSGYWEYRTYRANRLPSLTMDLTPAQYNRDITKRYDSGQDLDVYRTQQSYYAYGGLSVRQNLDLTGGTFYLESNLAYMRNFGDNSATQFTSVPIRLGYSQSLVGYNPFKWDRKIEPLKYERVKRNFFIMWKRFRKRRRIISFRWRWRRRNTNWQRKTSHLRILCTASDSNGTGSPLFHRRTC